MAENHFGAGLQNEPKVRGCDLGDLRQGIPLIRRDDTSEACSHGEQKLDESQRVHCDLCHEADRTQYLEDKKASGGSRECKLNEGKELDGLEEKVLKGVEGRRSKESAIWERKRLYKRKK